MFGDSWGGSGVLIRMQFGELVLLTQDVGAKLLNFFFQKVQSSGSERVKIRCKVNKILAECSIQKHRAFLLSMVPWSLVRPPNIFES